MANVSSIPPRAASAIVNVASAKPPTSKLREIEIVSSLDWRFVILKLSVLSLILRLRMPVTLVLRIVRVLFPTFVTLKVSTLSIEGKIVFDAPSSEALSQSNVKVGSTPTPFRLSPLFNVCRLVARPATGTAKKLFEVAVSTPVVKRKVLASSMVASNTCAPEEIVRIPSTVACTEKPSRSSTRPSAKGV